MTASTIIGMEMREVIHHDARLPDMRTTVILDDDVSAAVARLRRERGLGLSEALNELARAGMVRGAERQVFRQRSEPIGFRVSIDNVAEVLDLLDEPGSR
jgi:hypothetical protein